VFVFCLIALAFPSLAQRNVILIIADDLGTDYLGFYEDHADTVDVPNIRALISKGVRFKNLTSNPVCSATRSTLLTGRYGFRTGVGGIVGGTGGSNQLDTAEVTLPRLLKLYNPSIATANIGKWHLHNAMPLGNLLYPNRMGYDHFEGPFVGAITSYTNWTKYTNGVQSTVTNYATSENVNNAVSWLRSTNTTNPFFLWLAFNAPHSPYHLPPMGLHSYSNLSGTSQDITQNPKKYFKAALQALDTEIGRLFDSLQVMNRLDSTDIIFIGDNGNTSQTAQIANINKAKGTIYEYGVHVPMLIAGPSIVNPGRVSDALINTADIFSTVLELMGDTTWKNNIPANKPVDTKSVVPILSNQTDSIRPWSFCENFKLTPDANDGKAMKNKEYKLLKFDAGQEEFYNLSVDSGELNNLLTSGMSATDLVNYTYLCSEMTSLVGTGSFCQTGVHIKEGMNSIVSKLVYPNPFHSTIYISSTLSDDSFELSNNFGQLIYKGNHLAAQDFSSLPNGIYFLKIVSEKRSIHLKLIHN
jgi:arylsulfatase B